MPASSEFRLTAQRTLAGALVAACLLAPLSLSAQSAAPATSPPAASEPASAATIAANRTFGAELPWNEPGDFARATRGFIATRSDPLIRDAQGRVVWNLEAWSSLPDEAPATANPSLWRHMRMLRHHGLYQVAPRLYQVRGFDIANMTVIEGDTGLIIVDTLTTVEVARAAMELVRQHLGNKPVVAVIYTHPHADHFGGVKGVVEAADVASGRVPVIAPEHFLEHAVSENLIAGPAMSRRAAYQFGTTLPRDATGQLGAGIGMAVAGGTLSLIAPTRSITTTGETLTIDGITIEFQMTPGTEAPAEMNLFLPQLGALGLAENANPTLHNILPPRGAQVRDARAWAHYLTEALDRYGARSEVLFIQHGWPTWGRGEIADFIASHRDTYKFLHDQSVRLMNRGQTAPEIAEAITLPPELAGRWFNRGYYGTMRHNSRAVYQRYLGWYDANPANLNPWPPEDEARRYVAAMGGPQRVLREGRRALGAGDYRWASRVLGHLIFSGTGGQRVQAEARRLGATSFEQMGYQAESMLWRNMYLTAARELRSPPTNPAQTTVALDLIAATPSADLFELLAIRVDPERAAGKDLAVAFVFPDRQERFVVSLRNRVLVSRLVQPGDGQGQGAAPTPPVQATLTLPRPAFLQMLFAGTPPARLIEAGVLRTDGDVAALRALLEALDPPAVAPPFAIVTP